MKQRGVGENAVEAIVREIERKEILHGLDLRVPPGEVHAVMGPNGSGKSTLAYTLAGREGYAVTRGRVLFQGHDLTAMKPEERHQLLEEVKLADPLRGLAGKVRKEGANGSLHKPGLPE